MGKLNEFLLNSQFNLRWACDGDAYRGKHGLVGASGSFGSSPYRDPVLTWAYNSLGSGVEEIEGEGIIALQQEGHFLSGDVRPAFGLTLSGNTISTDATATASGASFSASDVGKAICYLSGIAQITGYTSTTEVTVAIRRTFQSAGPFTAGEWSIAQPLMEQFLYGQSGTPTRLPAATITLTAVGPGYIQVTASAPVFHSGDVESNLTTVSGTGWGLVTNFISTTEIIILCYTAFNTTSYTSGNWRFEVGQSRWLTGLYHKGKRGMYGSGISSGIGNSFGIGFTNGNTLSGVNAYNLKAGIFEMYGNDAAPANMYMYFHGSRRPARTVTADGTNVLQYVPYTADLLIGMPIFGSLIAATATISSIDITDPLNRKVTMNVAATGSGQTSITFSNYFITQQWDIGTDTAIVPTLAWRLEESGNRGQHRDFAWNMKSKSDGAAKPGSIFFRATDGVNGIMAAFGLGLFNGALTVSGLYFPTNYNVFYVSSGRNAHASNIEWLATFESQNNSGTVSYMRIDQNARLVFTDCPVATINPPANNSALFWDEAAGKFKFRKASGAVETIASA